MAKTATDGLGVGRRLAKAGGRRKGSQNLNAQKICQIDIRKGVPPDLRGAAARLYWRHFGPALQPLPTPARQGIALVRSAMNHERALIAVTRRGTLVGIAGLRGAEGGFLTPSVTHFHHAFGALGGSLRHLSGLLHQSGAETADLILDGVAVRPEWRRRGIGRALVEAASHHARHLGHPALMVEVEARNRDGLAAWRALAFQPAGRQRLGWPWRAQAHILRRPV